MMIEFKDTANRTMAINKKHIVSVEPQRSGEVEGAKIITLVSEEWVRESYKDVMDKINEA